jgi:hypothetical protein
MNLHQILIRHCAPKDCKTAMVCWAIANSEAEILAKLDKKFTHGAWTDRSNEDGQLEIFDKEFKVIGTESYLEKMARLRGEYNDEDASFDDAHYGVTHYGWSEPTVITEEEANRLLELGVAEDWRSQEAG